MALLMWFPVGIEGRIERQWKLSNVSSRQYQVRVRIEIFVQATERRLELVVIEGREWVVSNP